MINSKSKTNISERYVDNVTGWRKATLKTTPKLVTRQPLNSKTISKGKKIFRREFLVKGLQKIIEG